MPDPRAAWRRAAAYFTTCLLVSVATGALSGTGPPTHAHDARWWLALAGCALVEVVAYGVVWPRGTFTAGRPRRPLVSGGFGLVWGLCEGQLMLSVWVLTRRTGLPGWADVGVALVVLSAFLGLWHQLYWDVRVAPPHNIPEWNARKVLACHTPNLLVTLVFLAGYDDRSDRALFVLLQTTALVLSALAMRFPGPGQTPGQTVDTPATTA